jgi:hypothetical protein
MRNVSYRRTVACNYDRDTAMINETFLIHASEILGKTDYGFSGSQIVKYFNAKSVEYNIDIPYPKSPFPPDVPNKRTALLENLKCFKPEEQFQMISEICDLEIFDGKGDVEKLKGQLYERYSEYNGYFSLIDPLNRSY